jgi:hypothetical protein
MPYKQTFYRICQIGDHHVSLWMMPHKNSKHCGRLYTDFLFFVYIVLCFSTMLALRFHNIFIIHGKGHGKHTDVGCTMVGLCGLKSRPDFSLCMACVKNMVLAFHGKNQRFRG